MWPGAEQVPDVDSKFAGIVLPERPSPPCGAPRCPTWLPTTSGVRSSISSRSRPSAKSKGREGAGSGLRLKGLRRRTAGRDPRHGRRGPAGGSNVVVLEPDRAVYLSGKNVSSGDDVERALGDSWTPPAPRTPVLSTRFCRPTWPRLAACGCTASSCQSLKKLPTARRCSASRRNARHRGGHRRSRGVRGRGTGRARRP